MYFVFNRLRLSLIKYYINTVFYGLGIIGNGDMRPKIQYNFQQILIHVF